MMMRYIGHGDWLAGVPARDLSDDEVALYGGAEALLKSGLYALEDAKCEARLTRENKMLVRKAEDKDND